MQSPEELAKILERAKTLAKTPPQSGTLVPTEAQSDDYEFIAPYYEAMYKNLSETDLPFYLSYLIERPNASVLDAGCGTGRLARAAQQTEVKVTAIDISKSMLETLRSLPESEKIETHQADIRNFNLNRSFDVIYLAFGVLHHLMTIQEQVAALKCLAHHMNPNSILVGGLLGPSLVGLPNSHPNTVNCNGTWVGYQELSFDYFTQILEVLFSIDDAPLPRKEISLSLRLIFYAELELLLQGCGLQLTEAYSDYDKSPMTLAGGAASKILFVAELGDNNEL